MTNVLSLICYQVPTKTPTEVPTSGPTEIPSLAPTGIPSLSPTGVPSMSPTEAPTEVPTDIPVPVTAAPTTTPMSFTLKSGVPISRASLLVSLRTVVGSGVRIVDFKVQTSVPAEVNSQISQYDVSTPVGALNCQVMEEGFALALAVPRETVSFAQATAVQRRRTAVIVVLVETEDDISVRWIRLSHALICTGAVHMCPRRRMWSQPNCCQGYRSASKL